MAESRVYELIIKNETNEQSAGASSAVAGATTPSSSASASSASSGGILTKDRARTYMQAMTAWHTIKSFATQQINHDVSLVELRTGSRDMQERANFYNQIAQKGFGILEMTATGALVGGLPGALAGLALSTAHTVIGYAQRQQTLNTQQELENRSLDMLRMRAGAQGSRSYNQ